MIQKAPPALFHIGVHQTKDAGWTHDINWTGVGWLTVNTSTSCSFKKTEAHLIRNENFNETSYRKAKVLLTFVYKLWFSCKRTKWT